MLESTLLTQYPTCLLFGSVSYCIIKFQIPGGWFPFTCDPWCLISVSTSQFMSPITLKVEGAATSPRLKTKNKTVIYVFFYYGLRYNISLKLAVELSGTFYTSAIIWYIQNRLFRPAKSTKHISPEVIVILF